MKVFIYEIERKYERKYILRRYLIKKKKNKLLLFYIAYTQTVEQFFNIIKQFIRSFVLNK